MRTLGAPSGDEEPGPPLKYTRAVTSYRLVGVAERVELKYRYVSSPPTRWLAAAGNMAAHAHSKSNKPERSNEAGMSGAERGTTS